MDGVIKIEQARELVGNAALWPRVRDVLWNFAPQIHESWLEDLVSLCASASLRETKCVKRAILDSLGVAPCFHDFPKDDGSRLLLLDGATLLEIAKWLGALACADDLRRVTSGADVKALRAAFPGVYPEVFGYTAYFDFGSRRDAEPQSIVNAGFGMLFALLGNLPEPIVKRLKLKLPKTLCVSASLRETKITYPVILKLLKLKFPEAYSLCCS